MFIYRNSKINNKFYLLKILFFCIIASLLAILNVISINQENIIFGDVFFILSFIVHNNKNKVHSLILFILSMWFDIIWQLPLGTYALILLGQKLFINFIQKFKIHKTYLTEVGKFTIVYLILVVGLKKYVLLNIYYQAILLEMWITLLVYCLVQVWQSFKLSDYLKKI